MIKAQESKANRYVGSIFSEKIRQFFLVGILLLEGNLKTAMIESNGESIN
jgi:hypothetical protein